MIKNISIVVFVVLFFNACSFKDSLLVTNKNYKYGLYSVNNQEFIIKPIFQKLYFIDSLKADNKKIEHKNYFNLHWIHNNIPKEYLVYEYNNLYGVVANNKKFIFRPIFKNISKFYNSVAVVQENELFGYINKDLNLIQKPIFKDARDFLSKVSFVQSMTNDKYACIDLNMNLLTKFIYDEVYSFSSDFARFKKDNKWGFLDKNCNEVVKAKYDFAYDFLDNKAKVVDNEKIYFLNKDDLK